MIYFTALSLPIAQKHGAPMWPGTAGPVFIKRKGGVENLEDVGAPAGWVVP
jgi:hypothetical protein